MDQATTPAPPPRQAVPIPPCPKKNAPPRSPRGLTRYQTRINPPPPRPPSTPPCPDSTPGVAPPQRRPAPWYRRIAAPAPPPSARTTASAPADFRYLLSAFSLPLPNFRSEI